MAGESATPIARFDDLAAAPPRSWELIDPIGTRRAETLDAVRDCLEAADAAARAGAWVALTIAYEAAPAFDPAARASAAPPGGTPFVWWTAFRERRDVPAPDFGPSPVARRTRRDNVLPFVDAVADVRRRIERGDVYQVNVTDRIDGRLDGTPYDLYRSLTGVQTCAYAAYLDLGSAIIVSASPELFFRWEGGTITCRPMKGTAPRHPRADADRAAAATLATSPKERAENVMIVDLLRNDLSRLAETGSVAVPDLFTVERYETVWQLTSTVSARVDDAMSLTQVLGALFPCGSVTGAPKLAAMDAISALEREPRGIYCGAIGYLSPPGKGPRAVFSVPIRTAVAHPTDGTFVYGAGGGITWSSDPAAEDEEVRVKARILSRSRRTFSLLETMRQDGDGIRHLERHLERLQASADWFGIELDREATDALLAALERDETPHRVRLLIAPDGTPSVTRQPLDDAPTSVRLAVDTETVRSDDPFCCHKTTFRRQYDAARARHPDADDVVLVNESGRVVETTIANLAYRLDDRWYVPPLVDGGLAGVGRAVSLEAGHVTERSLPAIGLADCDALATISALRGWRPATLVDRPTH